MTGPSDTKQRTKPVSTGLSAAALMLFSACSPSDEAARGAPTALQRVMDFDTWAADLAADGEPGDLIGLVHDGGNVLTAIDSRTADTTWLELDAGDPLADLPGVTALAWDPGPRALYFATGEGDDALYTLPLAGGPTTRIGPFGSGASNIHALDVAPPASAAWGFTPGALYGISLDGVGDCNPNCLFRIDPATGRATRLRAVATGQARAMSFDVATGALWVFDTGNKTLYTLTPAGGVSIEYTVPHSVQQAGTGASTVFSIAQGCDGALVGIDVAFGALLRFDPSAEQARWVGGYGAIAGPEGSFDFRGLDGVFDLPCATPDPDVTPTPDPDVSPTPDPEVTPTPDPDVTPTPPAGPTACDVGYDVLADWPISDTERGFQAQVTFSPGDTPLTGWVVSWHFSGNEDITQLWQGIATQTGTHVSVENETYNGVVPAGGAVTFGFLGTYGGEIDPPVDFTLNGTPCDLL